MPLPSRVSVAARVSGGNTGLLVAVSKSGASPADGALQDPR